MSAAVLLDAAAALALTWSEILCAVSSAFFMRSRFAILSLSGSNSGWLNLHSFKNGHFPLRMYCAQSLLFLRMGSPSEFYPSGAGGSSAANPRASSWTKLS